MAEDTMELGGSIQLTGFSEIDTSDMIVIKKIVGNYVKKMADQVPHFQGLHMTMKKVHEKQGEPLFELHGKALGKKKVFVSEVTERNLYVGIDLTLKKICAEMGLR